MTMCMHVLCIGGLLVISRRSAFFRSGAANHCERRYALKWRGMHSWGTSPCEHALPEPLALHLVPHAAVSCRPAPLCDEVRANGPAWAEPLPALPNQRRKHTSGGRSKRCKRCNLEDARAHDDTADRLWTSRNVVDCRIPKNALRRAGKSDAGTIDMPPLPPPAGTRSSALFNAWSLRLALPRRGPDFRGEHAQRSWPRNMERRARGLPLGRGHCAGTLAPVPRTLNILIGPISRSYRRISTTFAHKGAANRRGEQRAG